MKAVCVSCFNYYNTRVRFVEQYLNSEGYDVHYITSDFDHIDKAKYLLERPNTTQVKVKSYYKNLSAQRLLSHYFFAKEAFKEIERLKPDLLYIMLPPNFLAEFASKYKRKNKKVKIIFDIYDLWPETFPSDRAKLLLTIPFKLWGSLRDRNLKAANVVVTECELYQEKLKHVLNDLNTEVLYLTKENSSLTSKPHLDLNGINISYLGSINSIIDIPSIIKLLSGINKLKPVTLHIIGDGENREQFIDGVKLSGVKVEYYGKIYDEERKKEIFDICSFGINMMKNSVCVGLTMKSIDYFQYGLPILNNIQGDTAKLVEENQVGINITDGNLNEVIEEVVNINLPELLLMRDSALQVFNDLFSIEAFNQKFGKILNQL
ncbi:hypothetical protein NYE44_24315 [Paenibacillus sp. FSL L8-0493]|uniref:hypothetical protein n=1 Tax=unclassified Paenibacillus TaxID=185978 RepID=UPI0030FC2D52